MLIRHSNLSGPTEEVDGLEREIKDIDASLASCGDPEAAAKKALDEAQGDLNRLLAALVSPTSQEYSSSFAQTLDRVISTRRLRLSKKRRRKR